jgi:CHAT domain-containing protein
VAPQYGGGSNLRFQQRELDELRAMPGFNEHPGTKRAVLDAWESGVPGIFHFAGHGVVDGDAATPDDYRIVLEDGEALDPRTLMGLASAVAPSRTFYFFNACDIGQSTSAFGSLAGWAPVLLRAGAQGFVGGLWPVFDDTAANVAGIFYQGLASDGFIAVGDAVRAVRARYLETGDPSYLAYAFYGDVNLRLRQPAFAGGP